MLSDRVTDYLRENRQTHLEGLKTFLRFRSIANLGDRGQCRDCAVWLADYLERMGFESRLFEIPDQPAVFASMHVSDELPTVLLYGHYDVQPGDPLELWNSDPFEPVIVDGAIVGRGTGDDKGQVFAHLMACEAFLKTVGKLPVNLKILIEGQEEIGSKGFEDFLKTNRELLAADAVLISDSSFFSPAVPAITYALRGIAYAELTVKGPSRDLHSGEYGGAVTNPINALVKMVAGLHDDAGRVTIQGFYDDVVALEDDERNQWRELLDFDSAALAEELGVSELGGGEVEFHPLERMWARPTLDCNGIVGGYTAKGEKTIIPSRASVKISMRLVADQQPEKILDGLREYVKSNTPAGVTAELTTGQGALPVLCERNSRAARTAVNALEYAFGNPAAMIRCGASIPVTEMFKRILGLDSVLMGLGLPSDKIHSPNEEFKLEHLWKGSVAAAKFMADFGRLESN